MKLAVKNDGELAKKDENASGLGILRGAMAWLQFQAYDFKGVREIANCQAPESCPPKLRLRNAILLGFAYFEDGEYDRALQCFKEVRNHSNNRSLLNWYWRMLAHLGLTETWLALGDLGKANLEADALEEAVSACGDSYMESLALETMTRLALANGKQHDAERYIAKALETVAAVKIPLTTWRVHAVAWEVYRQSKQAKATVHRSLAQSTIQQIANSLNDVESLRQSFLAAREVRGFLSQAQETALKNPPRPKQQVVAAGTAQIF
jgi:tetratricopeptide (TPR) repeat protein